MKKLFVILGLVVGLSATVIAQPRAIGGRLGYNLEASYQHSFGKNFLEVDAGLYGLFHGVQASVVYDWVFASPAWTPKGTWDWYAGVGGTGGYCWGWGHRHDVYYRGYGYGYVGITGQIGLSYTFWFPLQLSIDFRPSFGPVFYGRGYAYDYIDENGHRHKRGPVGFHTAGLWDAAFSVRYSFGK